MIFLEGVTIGRAFLSAYRTTAEQLQREELLKKEREKIKEAQKNNMNKEKVSDEDEGVTIGMNLAEAVRILNLSDKPTVEEIEESFQKIYDANSLERGNSFYLQSKAYRAREALLAKIKPSVHQKVEEEEEEGGHEEDPPSAVKSKD